VTAYVEGTLLYIGVEKGDAAKVNDIIAIVGPEGTDVAPLIKQIEAGETQDTPVKEPKTSDSGGKSKASETTESTEEKSPESSTEHGDRIKASPLARSMADESGIDLSEVKGSGEGGRIVKRDIENYKPEEKPAVTATSEQTTVAIPQFIGEERFIEKPVSQMRKTIAKRLSESLFTAPH